VSACLGEVRLLDCFHGARDQLRELIQRWDNRLTLERLSIAEQYREGRLAAVLKLELGGRLNIFSLPSCSATAK
jgi:hypothetical protein